MEQMIGPRRPFYKAGPVMRLGKIPADVFAPFIEDGSRSPSSRPKPASGAAIVDLSGNLPYDGPATRARDLDDVVARRAAGVGLEDLHAPCTGLTEQETMCEAVWQRLTLAQRAVLRAVVLERGRAFSARTRARAPARRGVERVCVARALQREDLTAATTTGGTSSSIL